jgi:MarR family 2-MHQ and catechol resistance regulon transcriptional repressor
MNREELITQYIDGHQAMSKALRTRFSKVFADEGFSLALVGVLAAVKHKQPISSREVATELGVTRGAVAQFVDALVQFGLIEKNVDTNDRRISYLTLTKEGKAKLRKFEQFRNKLTKEITKSLSDAELEQIIKINSKILQEL